MRTNLGTSFQTKAPIGAIAGRARIIARNTFRYTTADGCEVTRLHLTDVCVRDAKGRITLTSGGWKTKTTNDRINIGLQGTPYRLVASRAGWMITQAREGESVWDTPNRVPFYDGIRLPDAFGRSRAKAEREQAKAAKLQATIRDYVTRNIQRGKPLAPPDSGDCWHCSMFDAVKEGENSYTANPATVKGDPSHLLSHMTKRENYLPGSLIVNAFRDAGRTDFAARLFAFGDKGPDVTQTRRIVRRYLQKRLGLPYR